MTSQRRFCFPSSRSGWSHRRRKAARLKLLLQLPGTLVSKVTAKALVLLFAWIVSWVPGVVAIVLWRSYGGHVYAPETLNLLAGHLLWGLLSGGLAVAAAALAESAASAAIITLAFTVGTWALDFVAAGRGGFVQQLASYTPTAALRSFEQGLLRWNAVVVFVLLSCAAFGVAVIWLNTGRTIRARLFKTVAAARRHSRRSLDRSWFARELGRE